MCDIDITYDGAYNVVVECIECGTERGSSVVSGTTLGPSWTAYGHCETCGGYRDHEPVREAQRGEYDGHLICDDCDEQFDNTMDVDLHDCPAADSDDDGESDDAEVATDGGTESPITDADIEAAIQTHDDPDRPDALTVTDVRGLLDTLQQQIERDWGHWMDLIERDVVRVVEDTGGVLVLAVRDSPYEDILDKSHGSLPVTWDGVASQVVSATVHNAAERLSDRSWPGDYPLVVRKPAVADAGETYVIALINSLLRRGLSPGQAWAYYGVEICGHSRNEWASRCGYSDHSAVSEPLRKAERKLDV